ncbi:Prenyltransferase and squalene oxidase repeat [Musa troglodytarum]|uniref:Prenyltransferase and squalene oxidase repeat n=1 Tax=Musa troglodytarum TaxID=320322 RepID=A0A9E7KLP4_9LILI|nr:Prenyltransferase and squalene oxidase repeat [Musa troglodytarum]
MAEQTDLWKFSKENPLEMDFPIIKLQDHEDVAEEAVLTSLRRAISRISTLQAHDGHWPGDYGGPMFLLPGLNKDGGWGLHIEGTSTMFGTALTYVILRLLGEGSDGGDGALEKGYLECLTGLVTILCPQKCDYCHTSSQHIQDIAMLHVNLCGHSRCNSRCLKVLNMLCCWIEEPNSEAFKLHLPRVSDYLWVAEDGMKMQGHNGSQLWDTAFTVQAIISTNLSEEFGPTLKKAHEFVKNTQVLDDCPGDLNSWYRHISKGAWPFSTADHGWPVSDCTAEGLKTALLLSKISPEIVGDQIDGRKLYDAFNVIVSLMNQNGGFATYELTRSYAWLEQTAETISKRYGSWSICFTYGIWFGVKGLVAAGRTYESSCCIQKASNFLLSKQLASGGWGESYLSCQDKVYTNLEGNRTHAVNTGWAMLALIDAGQEIMGVFNRNCMASYSAYRNIFPIWALGEYRSRVLCPKNN